MDPLWAALIGLVVFDVAVALFLLFLVPEAAHKGACCVTCLDEVDRGWWSQEMLGFCCCKVNCEPDCLDPYHNEVLP